MCLCNGGLSWFISSYLPFLRGNDQGKGPHPMNPVARKPVLRKLDEAELLMLVAAAERFEWNIHLIF